MSTIPIIPFDHYHYNESDVTALALSIETCPAIMTSLSEAVEAGKIIELLFDNNNNNPIIQFRYSDSTVMQIANVGDYVVNRVIGDTVVMTADKFLAAHTYVDGSVVPPSEEAEAQIAELTAQLATKTAEAEALQTDLDKANEELAAANAALAPLQTEVDNLTASVTALETNLATANEANEALTTTNTEITSALTTAEANLATANESVDTLTTDNETLTSDLATANDSVNSLTVELATANGNIDTLTIDLAAANTSVETLTADLATANSSIETLTTDLETANGSVVTLTEDLATANGNIDTLTNDLASANMQITGLEVDLLAAEQEVDSLLDADKVAVTITAESPAAINHAGESVVITSEAPITKSKTITAQDVKVKDVTVSGNKFTVAATDSIELKRVSNEGSLAKSTSNAAIILNNNGPVVITESDFMQSGYNCIEIGLTADRAPTSVLIENVNFDNLSHNSISIFDQADGAEITIRNCHLGANAPYFLRYSNRSNVTSTINIIDCTLEPSPTVAFNGFICLQDYTETDPAAAAVANRFSPDKLTINITNLVGPNGLVTEPTDLAAAYGSSTPDQLMFVYDQATVPYTGNENRYPTVNFL